MKITNTITKPIFVSCTALALILGYFTKEVNAQNVTSAPGVAQVGSLFLLQMSQIVQLKQDRK